MTLRPSFEPPGNSSAWEEQKYFMGLDLGQTNDSTAIAVIRRVRFLKTVGPNTRNAEPIEERPSVFQCGYLERVPLQTPYPTIVNHVARLLDRPVWAGNIDLVIDGSGVGRPVVDMFTSAGVAHTPVSIVGGDSESRDGKWWRVPKSLLVSGIQALLHEGRLHIQKDLPEAANLVRELQDFRVSFTSAGHMTFGAREGKHDDQLLALAVGIWRSRKRIVKMQQIMGGVMAHRPL
jgi:hypothetical protein